MMKKAIISGIVFGSILLVGCNGEQKEEQVQAETNEVLESEKEVVVAPKNGGNDEISNFLSELKNEILVSITEQTALESESRTKMKVFPCEKFPINVHKV
ncbi:hypothetical protein ACIQYS_21390 [Psychrobacillus sp. NPDC096426]|uniref:hypothetical protein n=1 Tax=Psychrobacillus sp. NPDC096426 TaxID=3364491 RepID=UPI00381E79A9